MTLTFSPGSCPLLREREKNCANRADAFHSAKNHKLINVFPDRIEAVR